MTGLEAAANAAHAWREAWGRDVTRPHFLIYFDDVPARESIEAVGDDWGNVESLAMHTADNELRCDRIKIEKIGSTDVRQYVRNKAGIWYRNT